jgi:CubicO group peptidase (beta-lactamase class C family)
LDQQTFAGIVDAFDRAVADGVRMNSLLVSDPAGTFRHDFTAHRAKPVNIRSISKVVVSLAVGAAIAEGVTIRGRPLSLDLEIGPFFAEFLGRQSARGRAHLQAVRLRHLLTNTMGFDEGFLFRDDLHGQDLDALVPHAFSRELVHPPGAHFAYSNVGWFLLSVLVREQLGMTLSDWVTVHVLGKLGITDVTWVRYGRYEAGGTGLSLSAADVHKIGELLRDDGRYRGRQVVPSAWVAAMRSPVVPTTSAYDPPLRASGYGYGLWIGNGAYYCDGAGGQFLIIVPERRTIVVALAEAGDTRTVAGCLRAAL